MAAGLRLDLRQTQQLVMTPQLQQSIRLLQLSNLELAAVLAREVERNPLLRLAPPETAASPAEAPAEPGADSRPAADTAADTAAVDRWMAGAEGPSLGTEALDGGAENLFDEAGATVPGGTSDGEVAGAGDAAARGAAAARIGAAGSPGGAVPDTGALAAPPPSLLEHLAREIGLRRAPRRIAALALLLAGELDPDGYLRADPEALGARWGAGPQEMAAALALLQSCEPTGIGARSLAECLALQLAESGRLDAPMRTLLDNLEVLARGERARLCRLCGCDAAGLALMLRTLRRLDPRPGAAFTAEPPGTRVPDILLRPAPGGGWQVELNPETLPRLLIDERYVLRLGRGGVLDRAARRFLAECRASARWLLRSLDQRARTILAVAAAIVRHQEGFFREGVAGLVPLTRRALAEELGLHESTVSRVTAGKYMATPRGVLELGFFFTNAVSDGGATAAAVRARIRALVAAEPPGRPLSDDAIVRLLAGEGIEVARRTVAKYRQALGIPSSAERRRRARLGGG